MQELIVTPYGIFLCVRKFAQNFAIFLGELWFSSTFTLFRSIDFINFTDFNWKWDFSLFFANILRRTLANRCTISDFHWHLFSEYLLINCLDNCKIHDKLDSSNKTLLNSLIFNVILKEIFLLYASLTRTSNHLLNGKIGAPYMSRMKIYRFFHLDSVFPRWVSTLYTSKNRITWSAMHANEMSKW